MITFLIQKRLGYSKAARRSSAILLHQRRRFHVKYVKLKNRNTEQITAKF